LALGISFTSGVHQISFDWVKYNSYPYYADFFVLGYGGFRTSYWYTTIAEGFDAETPTGIVFHSTCTIDLDQNIYSFDTPGIRFTANAALPTNSVLDLFRFEAAVDVAVDNFR
jgi:hypothetical protein